MSRNPSSKRGKRSSHGRASKSSAAGDGDLDFSGFEEVERPGGALTPHHELEPVEESARFPERGENQLDADRRRQRDAERAGSAFACSRGERLRRGGALEASGQDRQHAVAEFGEDRLRPLASEQFAAKLALKLLDRARERGLRDAALFRRAGEIELASDGKEVSDLIHLHCINS